jgi:DNA-binding LacI/PurR family transcriptional regulator
MSRTGRRPATMRDVAARAGVSRSLVSTVFRGVPGASPATRERVLAAAAELGYRPDERARKLRSSRSTLLGLTLTATHPFHVALAEDLHTVAELRGYELALSWTTAERSLEQALDTLLAQRCAALILIGPNATAEEIGALADHVPGVPILVLDRETRIPTIDTIRVDDAGGLRLAVDHLADLGHRDIWYLDGNGFVSGTPRRAAYVAAMASRGLNARTRVVPCGGTRAHGAIAGRAMLDAGELPTAIIAYNDFCAFGLMDVLSRSGLRVPEDLSIVGFDDVEDCALPHLDLTTVAQDSRQLVRWAAQTVRARIDGAPPQGLQLMPAGPLIVRGSTGPVPVSAR